MFCEGLVVDLDGLLQLILLHQRVTLAGQRLAHQLVVKPQLASALHRFVTVLDARLIVTCLQVHCRPAEPWGVSILVHGDGNCWRLMK